MDITCHVKKCQVNDVSWFSCLWVGSEASSTHMDAWMNHRPQQVCFGIHGAAAKACGVDAKGTGHGAREGWLIVKDDDT